MNKKQTNNEEDKYDKKRIIMYIIIIIIIILSLITSCSCTSRFFGKLGGNCNCDELPIDNTTEGKEIIRNKDLIFDEEYVDISLSDSKAKLGFSYRNISPEVFYCTTSNPSIATCYVSDGYVIVNPKSLGEVIITLQTTANGKIYEATTTVNITDVTRYIDLSSNSGTIDLSKTKTKNVSYILIGLAGDITVTSSDESITTATVSNGVLKITAYKTGNVLITLSLTYNGREYTRIYNLTVINSGNGSSSSNNNKPNDSSNSETKNSDISLKKLAINGISVLDSYYIDVNESPIKLDAIPTDSKATIIYKGKEYSSLNDILINLNRGYNNVEFTVKAEDGTTKDYIVTIKYTPTSSSGSGSSGNSGNNNTKRYYIETPDNPVDFRVTNGEAESNVTIYTHDVFANKVTSEKTDNGIKVCSSKDNACVYIELANGYEKYRDILEFTLTNNGEAGPSSLGIKVTAKAEDLKDSDSNDITEIKLKVYGERNGEEILVKGNEIITLKVVRFYIVTFHAQGGYYPESGEDVITLEIDLSNNKIDLNDSKYKPEKDVSVSDSKCTFYEFIGYSDEPNGEIVKYPIDSKNNVIEVTTNLAFYAIYNKTENGTGNPNFKLIWKNDPSIFNNKEAIKLYGEANKDLIYPGANSDDYKYTIENKTGFDIYLEELLLTEYNICIDENSCVNMGYIVSIDPEPRVTTEYKYYLGSKGKYDILNKNNVATTKNYNPNTKISENTFKTTLRDNNGNYISIKKGESFTVMIAWKWIEESDKLDTSIGQLVANSGYSNYELHIGIKYYTLDDSVCNYPNNTSGEE